MTVTSTSWRQQALLAALAASALVSAARADDDRRSPPVPPLPKVQQECAACHIAYAPGLLPAASWQRLKSNLPRHFGTDGSLDAATAKEIGGRLNQHAGTAKKVRRDPTPPPEDRI